MNSDNQDTREWLEGEAYQEKQFEDYLRMNPVEDFTYIEDDDEEVEEVEEVEVEVEGNVDIFNKIYGTNFKSKDHAVFVKFIKKYNLTVDDDAFYYIQICHCCGNQPEDPISEFCSRMCEESYQDTYNCFHKNNDTICKMCIYNEKHGYGGRDGGYGGRDGGYGGRDGGYGGRDGGYFGEDGGYFGEDVDYTVTCERCVSKILYNDSIQYNEQLLCEGCAYDYDEELIGLYSEEQRQEIYRYAEKHNLNIEEAIDYQTHCHCCGNQVTNPVFDAENHQYCKKRCFEHCEDYRYYCYRGEECKVCDIWTYRANRDSLTAYDIQLAHCEPVLATIDAFKELKVHGQFYECLDDLAEYFGDLAFYGDDADLYY